MLEDEDFTAFHRLQQHPNVILTPHNAFNTRGGAREEGALHRPADRALRQDGAAFLWPLPWLSDGPPRARCAPCWRSALRGLSTRDAATMDWGSIHAGRLWPALPAIGGDYTPPPSDADKLADGPGTRGEPERERSGAR